MKIPRNWYEYQLAQRVTPSHLPTADQAMQMYKDGWTADEFQKYDQRIYDIEDRFWNLMKRKALDGLRVEA